MSYDIYLKDAVTGEPMVLDGPHQIKGGTYQLGGCSRAELNVTWNYAGHFRKVFGESGIRSIYGKSGAESLSMLDSAISKLGNDVDDDYWKPTEGNAKQSLIALRAFATLRPDGVWDGD